MIKNLDSFVTETPVSDEVVFTPRLEGSSSTVTPITRPSEKDNADKFVEDRWENEGGAILPDTN